MQELGLEVGDVVANKYRVERVIGRGGMGMVVEAVQLDLDRRVAIKFLMPKGDDADVARARFEREGRIAARLQGSHVARVVDVGRLDSGEPFMVMEYLSGRDLASLVRREGALEVGEAVGYVLQACEAIAEAHAAGVVHRDLKPANLFLARKPDGRVIVKVLDFGISKVLSQETQALTQTRALVGSPLYISPEQLGKSRNATFRTDIWGLGVVLYEVLAGRPAFGGDTVSEVYSDILFHEPEPLHECRNDVSEELSNIVARCLRKSPQQRFSTVASLAEALAPFAPESGESVAAAVRLIAGAGLAQDSVPPSAPKVRGTGQETTVVDGPRAADPARKPMPPEAHEGTLGGSVATTPSRTRRRVSRALWAGALIGCGAIAGATGVLQASKAQPEVGPAPASTTLGVGAARPALPLRGDTTNGVSALDNNELVTTNAPVVDSSPLSANPPEPSAAPSHAVPRVQRVAPRALDNASSTEASRDKIDDMLRYR